MKVLLIVLLLLGLFNFGLTAYVNHVRNIKCKAIGGKIIPSENGVFDGCFIK